MSREPSAPNLQQHYEELVAAIDGIVWEADARTFNFTFVSQQAERMLGYPVTEWFLPAFWAAHLHPDDREWAVEYCARATLEKRRHDFEYRMIAADGRPVWLRDIVSVIVEGGEATKLRGIMVDITDRKQAEATQRENAERLRLAAQASNVGMWDWDLRTNAAVFSREWKRQLGYEEHEIEVDYHEWERRLHPDDAAPTLAALRAYFDGTQPEYAVEFRLRHKDGTYRWIYARGEVFPDASGKPVRMLGCHVDVTERKLAEEERRAHLWFYESLDKVNRAMQGASDLEQMMHDVIEAALAIFGCDRAWLVYPCDPEAPSWRVPMECTRTEYPGVFALGLDVPTTSDVASAFRTVRASDGPVKYGAGSEHALPAAAERFGVRSMIATAIYPKMDRPYMFGLHQCSHPCRVGLAVTGHAAWRPACSAPVRARGALSLPVDVNAHVPDAWAKISPAL